MSDTHANSCLLLRSVAVKELSTLTMDRAGKMTVEELTAQMEQGLRGRIREGPQPSVRSST